MPKLFVMANCRLFVISYTTVGSWQGQLQTSDEDAFIYTVLKHFSVIRSTYRPTYLLTNRVK